jgi:alkylation response protein AidB-like acyl-CoA dehydrogenase
MEWKLDTKEQIAEYKQHVKELVAGELATFIPEIEKTHIVPERVYELLVENKLFALTLPKEYGGYGMAAADYFPILEEVAHSAGIIRMLVHGANGLWRMIGDFGTKQQKDWLLPLTPYSKPVLAFALTEPKTGSGADVGTHAVQDGDYWILNGEKTLITFADTAVCQVVITNTGKNEISAFLVQQDDPGFRIEKMVDTMGCHGSFHGNLFFENCRVHKDMMLGKRGEGLDVALKSFLAPSRTSIANSCVGIAQAGFDEALEYSRHRVTFGKPLIKRQAIQQMLGNMATKIQAGRLLVKDAAEAYDRGEDITVKASMAKYFCLEMQSEVLNQAFEIFGGTGYLTSLPIERIFRDGHAMRFEEGTATIQKLTVFNSFA